MRADIYNDFLAGHIAKWETPIATLKTNPALMDNDSLLLTYTDLLYGLAGYYLTLHNEKAATYLREYIVAVEAMEKRPALLSWYYAYKAAATAYQIAMHPYKAPFLGKRSFDLAYMAVQTDVTNPVAWVILGNAKYHAPRLMGGDKAEAKKYFHTATMLWEKSGNDKTNWLYVNTMAWEGFVEYQLEEYTEAKAIYTKLLDIAPGFFWVNNELLPDVNAKMAGKDQ